jgi:polyhydroxyalkanoate synthesis repressor PhaR
MPLIKRYPNRKLYNTETKQYITLDGVAALIQDGQEVQVVDNATGEDLTAVTLTQIILDRQKRKRGLLPGNILSGLVNALQHGLASPLSLWTQVNEEITRRIEALISRGDLTAEEGARLQKKLIEQVLPAHVALRATEDELERALAERGIPTRADLQRLADQVEALAAELDQVNRREGPAPSGKRRSRRKE